MGRAVLHAMGWGKGQDDAAQVPIKKERSLAEDGQAGHVRGPVDLPSGACRSHFASRKSQFSGGALTLGFVRD